MALYHSIDALRWKQQYEDGIATDESPYGFHHAEQYGFDVDFARDALRWPNAQTAVLITRLLGFDFSHAWTNRKHIAGSDIVWTMTEGEGFAIAFLIALRIIPRKSIICNVVWLLNNWHAILGYKKMFYRFLSKYITTMTVRSEPCLVVAKEAFPNLRSQLMYFGVNSDLLAPHPLRTIMPGEPLSILSMGSDKTRDWSTLLAAFGDDARFRLTIVC